MSTCKSLDEETAASLHALALGDIGPAELPANVVAQVRLFFSLFGSFRFHASIRFPILEETLQERTGPTCRDSVSNSTPLKSALPAACKFY